MAINLERCGHGELNFRWCLRALAGLAIMSISLNALADAPPAAKAALLALPKIYIRWELTETGSHQFSAGSNDIFDGAYEFNRSVKGVVPLNMAMPGSYPLSSMPMNPQEMMEQGRFIGWMAAPPDDIAMLQPDASGRVDLSQSPAFLPAEYTVDDKLKRRYRDTPSEGWGTETYITKGHGTVYVALSGMMLCDLKKMTCDINNIAFDFHENTDTVTVTSSSDVPGFEAKTVSENPQNHLPKVPEAIVKQLSAIPITLPLPFTATFSGPSTDGGGGGGAARVVTLKVTLATVRGS